MRVEKIVDRAMLRTCEDIHRRIYFALLGTTVQGCALVGDVARLFQVQANFLFRPVERDVRFPSGRKNECQQSSLALLLLLLLRLRASEEACFQRQQQQQHQ